MKHRKLKFTILDQLRYMLASDLLVDYYKSKYSIFSQKSILQNLKCDLSIHSEELNDAFGPLLASIYHERRL